MNDKVEEKYEMRKKTIIIVMLVMICIMAVGYAAFSTSLTINGTANIASTWKVVFTKIEEVSKTSGVTVTTAPTASGTSTTFNVDLKSPGDKIEYKITVENQGTLDAIISNIDASDTGSDAIKFEVSNIQIGDKLAAKATTTFNVTISYNENITSQPNITINILTIAINYVQDAGQTINPDNPTIISKNLVGRILQDNVAYSDKVGSTYVSSSAGIKFAYPSSATNGRGLYYTNVNTEDSKMTYYFRGDVDNNYVKFGKYTEDYSRYRGYYSETSTSYTEYATLEECNSASFYNYNCTEYVYGKAGDDIIWRIVRINEDGSVRLILQDSIADSAYSKRTSFSTGVIYSDSKVKEVIDGWYESVLKNNYSSYLIDAGFCNERGSTSSYGNTSSYSTNGSAAMRINTGTAQFNCFDADNNLLTTSGSTKGNKELEYPIGLITADEVMYAGAGATSLDSSAANINGASDFFLNNGKYSWTMSLIDSSSSAYYYIFSVTVTGLASPGDSATSLLDVRPVINLKSDVEVTSGIGTSSSPYVIKTN